MSTNTQLLHLKKWSIETYNTGTSAWVTATSWPRGSVEPFARPYVGTSQTINLANGSIGMFTPSTRYNFDPVTFTFHKRTVNNAFLTNIKTYLTDHTGVRITLHDSDSTKLEGYLTSINEGWDFTGEIQRKTVVLDLQLFDVDGSGTIG